MTTMMIIVPLPLIVICLVVLFYFINIERKKRNRVGYSETERWALLNIVTLGTFGIYLLSVMIYSSYVPWAIFYEEPVLDVPQWNYAVLATLLLPLFVYGIILTWGKNDQSQQLPFQRADVECTNDTMKTR